MTAPANNLYADATVITGLTGSIEGTCVDAEVEDGYLAGGGVIDGAAVWYSYTPTVSGYITFAATTDEGAGIYVNYVDPYKGDTMLTAEYCNTPSGIYDYAAPIVVAQAGLTIHVGVNIYLGQGPFTLSWSLETVPVVDGVTVTPGVGIYEMNQTLCYVPAVDEVWMHLHRYSAYPDDMPMFVRYAMDGSIAGYISNGSTYGAWEVLLLDPYSGDATLSPHLSSSPTDAETSVTCYAGLTPTSHYSLPHLNKGDCWSGVDGTLWKNAGTATGGATNGTVLQYALDATLLTTVALTAPKAREITVDSDGILWLFTPLNAAGAVTRVDPVTPTVTVYDLATTSPARAVQNFVYDSDRHSLWVLRQGTTGTGELVEFDIATLTVTTVIADIELVTWYGTYDFIKYDPWHGYVWLMNSAASALMGFDCASGTLAQRTVLPVDWESGPMAVTPEQVFVQDAGYGSFFRVSMASGTPPGAELAGAATAEASASGSLTPPITLAGAALATASAHASLHTAPHFVNDRDKLLQATTPRFAPGFGDALVLSAPITQFHVASGGAASPTTITVTATAVGFDLGGASVTFAAGGLPLTTTATTATLAYADLAGATVAVIDGTVTVDGVLYSGSIALLVVSDGSGGADGTDGTDGVDGQRGTVQVASSTYGATWSDADAVLILAAAGYGSPVNRDIVTMYSGSASVSKFYDSGTWYALTAYIDGNMLITGTLDANRITAGTITTDRLVVGSVGTSAQSAITVTDITTTGPTMLTLTMTNAGTGEVIAMVTGWVKVPAGTGKVLGVYGDITVNGTAITTGYSIFSSTSDVCGPSLNGCTVPVSIAVPVTVAAGSNTFNFDLSAVYLTSGTAVSATDSYFWGTLGIYEIKV
jgi:hypothetical protein